MPTIVQPVLVPNLYGRFNFGAWKIPLTVTDPAGANGTGIVRLRGGVSPNPRFTPPPHAPGAPFKIFTLPAGMRPVSDRWLTYQECKYLGMWAGAPKVCFVRPNGEVLVHDETPGYERVYFFDGVSFLAETTRGKKARRPAGRKSKKGPPRRMR